MVIKPRVCRMVNSGSGGNRGPASSHLTFHRRIFLSGRCMRIQAAGEGIGVEDLPSKSSFGEAHFQENEMSSRETEAGTLWYKPRQFIERRYREGAGNVHGYTCLTGSVAARQILDSSVSSLLPATHHDGLRNSVGFSTWSK